MILNKKVQGLFLELKKKKIGPYILTVENSKSLYEFEATTKKELLDLSSKALNKEVIKQLEILIKKIDALNNE